MLLDYFGGRRIVHELAFSNDRGPWTPLGEKADVDLRYPLQLIKTHTTCCERTAGREGHIVSRSVLHFEHSSLRSFLTSLRGCLR